MTSKQEVDELRAVAERNLADAAVNGLSTDGKFSLAYDAARTLATVAVRCAGYRVRAGLGSHHNTFQALEAAMGKSVSNEADYFDACRQKRNDLSYDAAHVATETEADELLKKAKSFSKTVEDWISKNHPSLAR